MVSEFPFPLPRGVTVAQVILDHFVKVRILARQPFDAPEACSWQAIRDTVEYGFFSQQRVEWVPRMPKARRMGCSSLTTGIRLRKDHKLLKQDDLTYLMTLLAPAPVEGHAFVYILACSDHALYIGTAGDLQARLRFV